MYGNLFSLQQDYRLLIERDFYPYWKQFRDPELGGILNCISNDGRKRLSDRKFTWSQGRWLWVMARLCELGQRGILTVERPFLERWMKESWDLITNHAVMADGCCCYVMERDGTPIPDERTGRFDASLYADCFALLGMMRYTMVMGLEENLPVIESLWESITGRAQTGDYLTEPYPVPEGYRIHGIPMILLNCVQEYIQMRQCFGLEYQKEERCGYALAETILGSLYDGSVIREYVSASPDADKRLLDRHVNPGHTLEDLWFLAEFLEEHSGLDKYLPEICKIAKRTFALGWDEVYGGLLRFVDRDGGKPAGVRIHTPYETLIEETWDMKLWWPHAEALYLFPYLYFLTGDEEMRRLYEKSAAYAFGVFPDPGTGEWIQIRERNGSPQNKVVALPVKDPFHIIRGFLKLLELRERV